MGIEHIVREFRQRALELYGDRLRNVILYGSWARGEATEDSDIDLAVVLQGPVVPCKEIDRLIDIITDLNLEYGTLISIYPVSEQEYAHRESPLLMNLRREGTRV